MNLVIVESPAKGKTIERYLGSGYRVVGSYGHVRDLPKSELGVDVEHDFEPKYIIPSKAKKTVAILKQEITHADELYLATDLDREGEAIAFHIIQAIKPKQKPKRIVFHEITKNAIIEAIKKPKEINMALVDAQQARRVLDRLVGYKLSPFLWKKIFKGLSAGRVQSVAVRLIVDREREIKAFKSEEYWEISAKLKSKSEEGKDKEFIAKLIEKERKKIEKLDIKSEKEAKKILEELEGGKYQVENIEQKKVNRWPYPPFTTSTLQQEAAKRLHFSAKQTMKLAQDLYEAGKITYMRTDSVNLAQVAIDESRKTINDEFGKKYLPDQARIYKTKSKSAQEAHEAIRPTYPKIKAEELEGNKKFEEKHFKLYDLIRRRLLACQMQPAILDTMKVNIDTDKKYKFRANGSRIEFDGFLRIWPTQMEENILPQLSQDEELDLIELLKKQHFTQPPARYSEASLIKALEEYGIGRPSTYAPTISTIQDRGYVFKDQGKFTPKEVGFIVTDLLVKHFPDIVDLGFTAKVEEDLDKIAEGKENWKKFLKDFYTPFEKNLESKYNSVEKQKTEEKTDKKCPDCKKDMVIKMGRFGKFLACTGFPECKHTEPIIIKTGLKCPDCKTGDIIERKTKRRKTFWGCSAWPKCKWASWENPLKKSEARNPKPETRNNRK